MKNQELANYYNKLLKAQTAEKEKQGTHCVGRIENPPGTCKTLWIPVYSGNRTAAVNLNHELIGFDEDGILWGANGNCGTLYAIVQIPNSWPDTFDNEQLDTLSSIICLKMGKDSNYPQRRVLKADHRLPLILEAIEEMSK